MNKRNIFIWYTVHILLCIVAILVIIAMNAMIFDNIKNNNDSNEAESVSDINMTNGSGGSDQESKVPDTLKIVYTEKEKSEIEKTEKEKSEIEKSENEQSGKEQNELEQSGKEQSELEQKKNEIENVDTKDDNLVLDDENDDDRDNVRIWDEENNCYIIDESTREEVDEVEVQQELQALMLEINTMEAGEDEVTYKNYIIGWGDSMLYGQNSTINPMDILKGNTKYSIDNRGISGLTSKEIMNDAIKYYEENDGEGTILIIEMGSNGGWLSYTELASHFAKIIKAANTNRYIIVGDTDDFDNDLEDGDYYYSDILKMYIPYIKSEWEWVMEQTFGNHFFNTRLYMLENAFIDCNVEPSSINDEDVSRLQQGYIPDIFKTDYTHFNENGYTSMGIGIYKKGVELGYWN